MHSTISLHPEPDDRINLAALPLAVAGGHVVMLTVGDTVMVHIPQDQIPQRIAELEAATSELRDLVDQVVAVPHEPAVVVPA